MLHLLSMNIALCKVVGLKPIHVFFMVNGYRYDKQH